MTTTELPVLGQRAQADVDVAALRAGLEAAVEGEVGFDAGSRHLYATDSSNFRQLPIGVVVPRTLDDVVATNDVCREHGVPLTSRGGGTSLAGQACNVAVVLDHSRWLTAIEEVDVEGRTAVVQPGLVLDDLADALGGDGLTWGPKPATHNRCTIGGMLGNNSCGTNAFRYGRAEDNVAALEVLLPDGTRTWLEALPDEAAWDEACAREGRVGQLHRELRALRDRYGDALRERFPAIPRRVSGYSLVELLPEFGGHVARALVGSEGTCVTILRARLDLNRVLQHRVTVALGYDDVYAAGDAVARVRHVDGLVALEGVDQHLIDNILDKGLHADAVPSLPDGHGWLLCEVGADTQEEAEQLGRALVDEVADHDPAPATGLFLNPDDQEVVWQARESGLGATAHVDGVDAWPGWEDSAVHPDDVGDYLRDLRALFDQFGYDAAVYGHFGDGCIHCRIDFELTTPDGVATYVRFLHAAADLVDEYGGSYSGEHGDGQQRGVLLTQMYGEEVVEAFRTFKAIWDPHNRMNPGKVVDAFGPDEHLRLGADHRQWHPETTFAYPADGGDFNRAQLRCVGVGQCRRDDGHGTMCPSYMVTHEEQHSTRGRARLLYEMLEPDSDLDGWRDESVKEALDLCLSCKGCVADCPVNVDMATYKAEFLHHHYEGRLHPRVDYAMGLIDKWSALARLAPGVANWALSAPGLGWVLKRTAGVATQRPAPTYAARPFRSWFEHRPTVNPDGEKVILFPDTFVDNFEPEVGRAMVEVLESYGYRVEIPSRRLCCGRPLYDYGFLDLARAYLDGLLDEFRDDVAAGVKVVGMEPSCVAVFRDELIDMLPDDADAQRLAKNTFLLSEFLVEQGHELPQLHRETIVHGHCHHKGGLGTDGEEAALDAMGLDWQELDAGCCGLAGSFGFEAGDKYEVSVAAGERKLLPAVRDAADDTIILANGFSCRTQVDQLQDDGPDKRRPLHLAQVMRLAQEHGEDGPPRDRRPEDWFAPERRDRAEGLTVRDGVTLAAVGALVAAALTWWRRR